MSTLLWWLAAALASLALVGALGLLAWRRSDVRALMRLVQAAGILGTLRGVWGLMHDERVPLWLRLLPIPVLVYLASPIDLMPDVIPVLGQLDDILIVGAALWVILRFVPFAVVRSHFVPRGERTSANGGGDDGGNDGTIGGAGV